MGSGDAPAVDGNGPPAVSLDGAFAVGDRVEITGLQAARELNGRRGRVVRFVAGTSRYGIQLDGEDAEPKAVRAANLRRLELPPALVSTSPSAVVAAAQVAPAAELLRVFDDIGRRLRGDMGRGGHDGHLREELEALSRKVALIERLAPPEKAAFAKAAATQAAAAQSTPIAAVLAASSTALAVATAWPELPQGAMEAVLPTLPPVLPVEHEVYVPPGPLEFEDEAEYPDRELAVRALRISACTFALGFALSQAAAIPATWLVWTFFAVHGFGLLLYNGVGSLLLECATLAFHAGFAANDALFWLVAAQEGDASLGPWSLLVVFASTMYLHCFWNDCVTLPPDYITGISLFFPQFPMYNLALALSCGEFFLEWRYFPEHKVWLSVSLIGAALMACGQALIAGASAEAGRNFWASCRKSPPVEGEEEEDEPELEIPDRRVVQERLYRWERHPAYLGAMLWGVGSQVVLCNPIMLATSSFVLWGTLLYAALDEEDELWTEFKDSYTRYAALTPCWIPFFNEILESTTFQREMSESFKAPGQGGDGAADAAQCSGEGSRATGADDDEDCDAGDDGASACPSEDMLPAWAGIPRGGALWNQQYREPLWLG